MIKGWCPIQFSGWQHHTEGPLGTLGTVLSTLRLLVLQTVVSWYLLRSLDFIPAGTHTASLLLVSGAILKLSTRWENFVFDLFLFNRCLVNHVGCPSTRWRTASTSSQFTLMELWSGPRRIRTLPSFPTSSFMPQIPGIRLNHLKSERWQLKLYW